MVNDQQNIDARGANISCYDDYYEKPYWWFKLRYDTQVKRKTCLHLVRKSRRSLSNQKVLEIGFGSGATLFSFNRNCEIVGIELSKSAVNQAIRNANKIGFEKFHFHLVDSSKIQYPDNYFDIVIASHVLEHVEDDKNLLDEIYRVLKLNGIVVILVPINEKYQDPNHFRQYTSREIGLLAQECNFNVYYKIENERLFHLVDRLYFEGYSTRWKHLSPAIKVIFNVPTALMPFPVNSAIEGLMKKIGYLPRQAGLVLVKGT